MADRGRAAATAATAALCLLAAAALLVDERQIATKLRRLASDDADDADDHPRLCPSPSGFHPCECIHEVPSGTRAEEHIRHGTRSVTLHHPDGTRRRLEACRWPPPPPPSTRAELSANPCKLDWAHAAPMEAFFQHSRDIAEFDATYVAPATPAATKGNVLYWWIGLQDLNSTENPVIQPVLSFVDDTWYAESWNCCPAGHKLKSVRVGVGGAGAVVRGSIRRDANGRYSITSTNASGATSLLVSDDTSSGIVRRWNWVDLVLETYAVADCAEYAIGTATFDGMRLVDVEGQELTPRWSLRPYIDGAYLPAAEAEAFAACCDGAFDMGWPSATMRQNVAVAVPVVAS